MGRSQPKDSKKAKKWSGNFTTNNNKWKGNPSKTQLLVLIATALPNECNKTLESMTEQQWLGGSF